MDWSEASSSSSAMASPTATSPSSNPIKSVFNGVQSQASRWFRHISEAAEAYKTRDGKNRRPEPLVAAPTHDEVSPEPSVQEKTKDSEETSNEVGVKEEGAAGACSDLLAPPGGSTSSITLDAESSPVSASPSESPSTTPQASPSSVPSDNGETSARKIGDGLLLSSPSQRRRIEPLRLTTEESSLIQPSEVVVSQRPVLTAEPVLTPIEKLRRKDEEIRLALAEKTQLVADILHVPREEFETIAELAGEPSVDKEATELVLAAVNQANHLTSILNEVLRVTEEDAVSATSEVISGSVVRRSDRLPAVPAHKLQDISSSLNKQLTQLLKIVRDRDEERERLRRELQRSREQLHCMHESQRRQQNLNLPTSPTPSRPSSYVSVGSSSEQPHDSEEDTGLNRLLLVCDQEEDIVLELEDKHATLEPHEEAASDVFVDALSGEAENHLEGVVDESSCLEAADNLVEGVVSPDPPIQD
uniref:Uncharacterized protein n=1 Tax=Timema tahoe TaxID=61484 RepID=A0A7R9FG47_9NEOP|nr:unnamed protein product [Timema tahoe]